MKPALMIGAFLYIMQIDSSPFAGDNTSKSVKILKGINSVASVITGNSVHRFNYLKHISFYGTISAPGALSRARVRIVQSPER
jgi:hypothetical protein